ncbi:hypothetical protein ACI2KR_27155 [Pseudomonas luteola]
MNFETLYAILKQDQQNGIKLSHKESFEFASQVKTLVLKGLVQFKHSGWHIENTEFCKPSPEIKDMPIFFEGFDVTVCLSDLSIKITVWECDISEGEREHKLASFFLDFQDEFRKLLFEPFKARVDLLIDAIRRIEKEQEELIQRDRVLEMLISKAKRVGGEDNPRA